MLKLYNSLSRKIEEFKPQKPPDVGMYTCGQTVYDYTHIGHGRKYVNDDVLRRTLAFFGYKVTHVQNVTDVGHLVSDADAGEDKLEKGARKTGKTVWEVAQYFTRHFYQSMDKLNNLRPTITCKATDHILEQIELIQVILDKGLGYDTAEAVYFNTAQFHDYNQLFNQKLNEKKTAVRQEVNTGEHKKNPADFVLWFKRTGRFANHSMHWESPWGDGFPGWHIECSAMSLKYLGNAFVNGHFNSKSCQTIDIHTGGMDHLMVHHPNEIAQSQAATSKKFVNYWVHHAMLIIEGKKMSKSLQNFYRIEDVEEKGFDAMALRYLYLSARYRQPMNFSFEALTSAQNSFNSLSKQLQLFKNDARRSGLSEEKLKTIDKFQTKFRQALANDLNFPRALSVVWEVVKSSIPSIDKYDLITSFNEVLGFKFELKNITIPVEVENLARVRRDLRMKGDYKQADDVRKKILELGYTVEDRGNDFTLSKK